MGVFFYGQNSHCLPWLGGIPAPEATSFTDSPKRDVGRSSGAAGQNLRSSSTNQLLYHVTKERGDGHAKSPSSHFIVSTLFQGRLGSPGLRTHPVLFQGRSSQLPWQTPWSTFLPQANNPNSMTNHIWGLQWR